MNQVILKPAEGRQQPKTIRLDLDGRSLELDLTHEPNLDLAVELGYVFLIDDEPKEQR